MRRSALTAPLLLVPLADAQDCELDDFVNFETPHVHPLELSADGSRLFAVNTPDNRLAILDATQDPLTLLAEVPVGLDPVSVRLRTPDEVWVVNHVSDSVSVIDLSTDQVVATLSTADEPCDVVFAGSPQRAFVSCSQANLVQVFDPSDLSQPPVDVAIDGEDPRALAVSGDGTEVYAAIFESGNATTVLGGGGQSNNGFPPNVVNDKKGPYNGVNPPPNDGVGFDPPLNPNNPAPPKVGLIVKKDPNGSWFDDNAGDWTELVSGAMADKSGRPVGWDMPDHDVAILDVTNLTVDYADGLMNLCMAASVDPATGRIAVVGTDGINHVRFEPNLRGIFLRVQLALVDPTGVQSPVVVDLNPHLDYTMASVSQGERDRSIGDPRAIVWRSDGARAYVAGMGSNNLVVVDATGARAGLAETIEVGEGPTGLALDEARDRLYVLDKFASTISVVDTTTELRLYALSMFDPSPAAIRAGRPHLYDTHATSGLGQASCASCHADARMDRLSWDLGDPTGTMKPFSGNCPDGGCEDWHPMKGPMLTQTLQDIIGKEPHHWRADREGIEAFEPAFVSLLGDDAAPSEPEVQAFEDFLATIHFPPNPFRELDNELPTNLPLPGHFTTGRFAQAGQPLPDGDATRGLDLFRPPNFLDGVACVTCHTLPTGLGTDYELQGNQLVPIPPGRDGEHHHALVSLDGSTNVTIKIPHLRNLYDRVGFDTTQLSNRAGAGFLHDGSVDSIARFIAEPVFGVTSDQDVADLVAFMLAFSGSDLPEGSPFNFLEPPGTASLDAHAAVGVQTTLVDAATATQVQLDLIADLDALADAGAIGLVVKGSQGVIARGWAHAGADLFQADRLAETATLAQLLAAAAPGAELTFTAVPAKSATRIGVDRDRDGFYDRDELDAGSDPADCDDVPGGPDPIGEPFCDPAEINSTGFPGELEAFGSVQVAADDVLLAAGQLPPGELALLLVSPSRGGFIAPGGVRGGLCLGPFAGFVDLVGSVDGAGEVTFAIDLSEIPTWMGTVAVQPGERWHFQVSYFDAGLTRFTSGVRIDFQ